MESPLYDDGQIQIKLAEMPQDHLLGIKNELEEEYSYYHIARSGLRTFAFSPRNELEKKLNNYNPMIHRMLRDCNLTVNDAHIAFLQAYMEDEERIKMGVEEMMNFDS
jgi:hypothetical protein